MRCTQWVSSLPFSSPPTFYLRFFSVQGANCSKLVRNWLGRRVASWFSLSRHSAPRHDFYRAPPLSCVSWKSPARFSIVTSAFSVLSSLPLMLSLFLSLLSRPNNVVKNSRSRVVIVPISRLWAIHFLGTIEKKIRLFNVVHQMLAECAIIRRANNPRTNERTNERPRARITYSTYAYTHT